MNKEVLPAESVGQGRLKYVPSEDGAALRALWQKQNALRRIRRIWTAILVLFFMSLAALMFGGAAFSGYLFFSQTAEISQESLHESPVAHFERVKKVVFCIMACFIGIIIVGFFVLSVTDKKALTELYIPVIRRLFGGKDDDYISYYITPGSNQELYPEGFKKYAKGISESGLATILGRYMRPDYPLGASFSDSNVKMHFAGIFYRNVCKYWRVMHWMMFKVRRSSKKSSVTVLSVWDGDCFSIEYPKDYLNLRISLRQKTAGCEFAPASMTKDDEKIDARSIIVPKPFGVTYSDLLEGMDASAATSASKGGIGWLTERFDITFSERADADRIIKVFDYELVGQFFRIADRFGGTLDIVMVEGGLLCFIDKSRSHFDTPNVPRLSDFDSYLKKTRREVSDVREMCLVLETIVERMRALHL